MTWRKVENEEGFPYYINESSNERQWDHPKFSDIRQRLDECNYIKYSMYRVAIKLRMLQQSLYMDEVPLSIISGVFLRHRLGMNESSLNLESCDLEAVLSDIYFAANKKNHTNNDVDYATELMVNFLYNVFDGDRAGKIQVSSAKLALALLSNCQLDELHNFIFGLCADHNNCVTRLRLRGVLVKLVSIAGFLREEASFGGHLVNGSVEDCFSKSPGLVGIHDSMFVAWLEKGPKIFSWLPVLHRIKASEAVVHNGKCRDCKVSPLVGLKYVCVKCPRYAQCQKCFFSGRTKNAHKLSHAMREHCRRPTGSGEFAMAKALCGMFPCAPKRRHKLNDVSVVETKSLCEKKTQQSEQPVASPEAQLQVIIKHLELQNKELQQLLVVNNREKDIRSYLAEHRNTVSEQIHQLKLLSNVLKLKQETPMSHQLVQSTPMYRGQRNNLRNVEVLSPIEQESVALPQDSGRNDPYRLHDSNNSTIPMGLSNISSWIGGRNETKLEKEKPKEEFHGDLDDALAKLQQILANNLGLDESLADNCNLREAVTEVEGALSSIIDGVESSRAASVGIRPECLDFD